MEALLRHVLCAAAFPADDKKRLRGFAFLSQKPILYVVNISEATEMGNDLDAAVAKCNLAEIASRPNAGPTAICGKVEAELAEMSDEEAPEFLSSYGLNESGLTRLIHETYELLGLISFFTVGEDECRAWTVPRGVRAQEAAGAIHSDLEKHFTAPRRFTGTSFSTPDPRPTRAPRAPSGWRARNVVKDGDVKELEPS